MSDVAYAPRLAERTPLDWRDVLMNQLGEQRRRVAVYEAYYDGEHPLAFTTAKFREAFGSLFDAFADNWCQLIVDSSVERLEVVGFQVDGAQSSEAWDLWQANGLDVASVVAHTEAGKVGRCYLLVDPTGDVPRITVEHASEVYLATDPGDRRRRLAALKYWRDAIDGYVYATLYLPEVVLRFESEGPVDGSESFEWVARSDANGPELVNRLGVVPVIELANKPGLRGVPHSDLEPAIPLQDAINKLCSDLIIASEYGAFPQRVITGWEVPKDPDTGEPLVPGAERAAALKAALSRAWSFGDPQVAVTSLPAADLRNFTVALELFVQHLAAQTRTPPHYLLGQVVNASGDALSVAEAGLVAKCRAKIRFFSDPWEEALALAMTAAGTPTEPAECQSMWADPERQTQAQHTDAATKKKALGVPLEVIWLELGYTPAQIERMLELVGSPAELELEQAAGATAPATTTPPGAPPPAQPNQGGANA
jgi:hypothetical protein